MYNIICKVVGHIMSWWEVYIFIATSGGITSAIVTFLPVLKILKRIEYEKNITNSMLESPVLSFIVWAILAAVFLPFIVPSLLSEEENNKFIKSVTNTRVTKK